MEAYLTTCKKCGETIRAGYEPILCIPCIMNKKFYNVGYIEDVFREGNLIRGSTCDICCTKKDVISIDGVSICRRCYTEKMWT